MSLSGIERWDEVLLACVEKKRRRKKPPKSPIFVNPASEGDMILLCYWGRWEGAFFEVKVCVRLSHVIISWELKGSSQSVSQSYGEMDGGDFMGSD